MRQMGCSARERSLRNNRRTRTSIKSDDRCNTTPPSLMTTSSSKSFISPIPGDTEKSCIPPPHPSFEEAAWRYCTQDHLEGLLLKNLEFLYNEAISRLISLGYDEELALRAILRHGHCYGSMDILTNILQNSITHINHMACGGNIIDSEETDLAFSDLRQLVKYSLEGMICLLRQVRPHLSKGDAMWCLLMSNLHVGRANAVEIPLPHGGSSGGHGFCKYDRSLALGGNDDAVAGGLAADASVTAFAQLDMRDIECPKRFNLSPALKSLLRRNVAIFAAGFRASVHSQVEHHACRVSSSFSNSATDVIAAGSHTSQNERLDGSKSFDALDSVLGSFSNLTLGEESEGGADQKNEMILRLMNQVRDLEEQVKERKEWAHQKALQAARKLSKDLSELKVLRMEREETLRLKKGKQALDDTTMKRLSEMESALKKASGQVDRANAAVRHLENENAEMRAEMEASKLSASESVTTCLEVAKREKKCLKRLLAWEKQKVKLQEEIAEEKEKIIKLQHELVLIKETQKETEIKWKQEVKAKDIAFSLVEEERKAKEAAEASAKRRQESFRSKIELDLQRCKDDIKRLEEELSHLKDSAVSKQHNSANIILVKDSSTAKFPKETNLVLLHELQKLQESSQKVIRHDRQCIMCMRDEVSIVFLPCTHQVLCVSCNEDHLRSAKIACPCCLVKIDQRIRVFGAAS